MAEWLKAPIIMKNRNEYHRKYNLDRYYRRKNKAVEMLGSICKNCGQSDNLQFDHIDPQSKAFTICDKLVTYSWAKIEAELTKCQLLCVTCHGIKTLQDKSQIRTKDQDVHGTLSSYRYCKCDLCVKANADYMKQYRKR